MFIQARGIKAWIAILIAIIIAIVILVFIFNLIILLLPVILILLVLSYFFRILNKVKKGGTKRSRKSEKPKMFIDVKHKVKR